MFDLNGRIALVTGASGGIGTAIARSYVAAGATVVLSGTREAALAALASELGERAHVVVADLSSADGADALAKAAETAAGPIDILVHNAGITRDNLTVRLTDADWLAVMDVNLAAGFRLARAVLRGMMRRRWGRIIAITSVVAVTGNPGQANYAASKAGLIGMIKAMAHEVASRGITANCIAPGFIETDMTAVLPADRKATIMSAIPMGRLGMPEDVAASAVYLASEEAAYITGQTLHVNGGMAMAS